MSQDLASGNSQMTIEEIQDYTLSSGLKAQQATDHLEEMVNSRRAQTESVVSTVRGLMDRLKQSEIARMKAEEQISKVSNERNDLAQRFNLLTANYARLSDGYGKMVRLIEETRSSSINMNERIDSLLLHYDLGMGRDGSPILPSTHVDDFRGRAFGSQDGRPVGSDCYQSLNIFDKNPSFER